MESRLNVIGGMSSYETLVYLQRLLDDRNAHYLEHFTNIGKLRPLFHFYLRVLDLQNPASSIWSFQTEHLITEEPAVYSFAVPYHTADHVSAVGAEPRLHVTVRFDSAGQVSSRSA